MANAQAYRGPNAPFFPLQGPKVQRGNDVRILPDAANAEYPPISKRLTKSEEDAVWAKYEFMPPAPETATGPSLRRWLIPGVLAVSFILGIGYAALNDRPTQIREPALAASETPGTDTSATALMGGAPAASEPTMTTQSASDFSAAQPATISPPPSTSAPSTATATKNGNTANAAVERSAQPAPKAAKVPPPIVAPEPAIPAPTYSRGEAPATTASAATPTPLPGPSIQEPAMQMDLAPPAETIPSPGSVPENAQTPQ